MKRLVKRKKFENMILMMEHEMTDEMMKRMKGVRLMSWRMRKGMKIRKGVRMRKRKKRKKKKKKKKNVVARDATEIEPYSYHDHI